MRLRGTTCSETEWLSCNVMLQKCLDKLTKCGLRISFAFRLATQQQQYDRRLKVLMETYYDLGPGASSFQYKYVQEIISNFGKGDKDKHFDIRKFTEDLQQARGAYKFVHDLQVTSGPRKVIKPKQEVWKECLKKIARMDDRMVGYAIGKNKTSSAVPRKSSWKRK
jgi:hypothetical protein